MKERKLGKSVGHKSVREAVADSIKHDDARAKLTDFTLGHKSARAEIEESAKNTTQNSMNGQIETSLPPRSLRKK